MGEIRYQVIQSEDIDFLEALCNGLMRFQAERSHIRPDVMGSMNYQNRLKPEYAATRRKHLVVAYDGETPVGFAFGTAMEVTAEAMTAKPAWAEALGGLGFYPEGYTVPQTVGVFKLLYVQEAYRGTGMGKQLSDSVMTWLGSQTDATDLWVYVANGNEGVGRFYETYGFTFSHRVYNGFIEAYCRKNTAEDK